MIIKEQIIKRIFKCFIQKSQFCLCMVLVIQILIKKKIKEIINLYGPFNIIFVSHAWLYDGYAEDIDPWPKSGLSEVN